MADTKFCADYDKRGAAACKKCKQKISKGSIRLGKMVPNPFSDSGGDMKQWYHVSCLFETFLRARATTKKLEDPSDIEGWEDLKQEDKDLILKEIASYTENVGHRNAAKSPKAAGNGKVKKEELKKETVNNAQTSKKVAVSKVSKETGNQNDTFRDFRRLCAKIADESSYISKTNIVSEFFTKGPKGDGFSGDLYVWVKLLIPGFVKRIYNLQSKQLVNLFSQIFGTRLQDMITDLEKGDVADTIFTFFEKSAKCQPASKSTFDNATSKLNFTVDEFLDDLTKVTKEEDQIRVLTEIAELCTSNDLRMIIRLIKRDLRINAGAKHILEGVHPDAYDAFQASRNLKDVIDRILAKRDSTDGKPGMSKVLSIKAALMTPILPMLAEACKSVEQAMKKCPNGMYAEIKYDGERVQVHKQGNQFSYFSRSLKPVLPHKVEHFKKYIPEAFPDAQDLILDSEVLLVDNNTGLPLPFGTLGVHKKAAFMDANVCLFVFDCIHINGQNLLDRPLKERKRILKENMKEIPNRVKLSEMKHITKADDLKDMIMDVLRKGLEGLVLKDVKSLYEPGKRHWLKVKKDYLAEGVMADLADLVVLGAFYGTGNKGGMMSIFLMGCYDHVTDKWCTVTKVSGGHDDKTLERLQSELDMVKISKDSAKVPPWLNITKSMVPDFVARDPKKSQVWEIVGAEFSKAEVHTAKGISIRFPRVTRIRDDKTWKEATNLQELEVLFENSKDHCNLPDLLSTSGGSDTASSPKGKKRIASPSSLPSTPAKRTRQKESSSSPTKEAEITNLTPPKKHKGDSSEKPEKKYSNVNDSGDEILPSFFSGVKLFLPSDVPKFDMWRRYIISYNGDMVDEFHLKEATHIIVESESSIPRSKSKTAVCVNLQWLSDSIKLQKLQSCEKYSLK
ncbi:DNA ligase 3 [Chamberlinius hualienensis]